MSAQVAADLRAAAGVLKRGGWTQGDYEKADGSKCAVGALIKATGLDVDSYTTLDLIPHKVAFKRVVGEYPLNFNDEPDRTADEVIAALEAAAAAAEQQPQPQSGNPA